MVEGLRKEREVWDGSKGPGKIHTVIHHREDMRKDVRISAEFTLFEVRTCHFLTWAIACP